MTLVFAIVVAVIFGAGVQLMLSRDLLRVIMGSSLISNSAILFIMALGLSRGHAPIHPLPHGTLVSDPLVQALALTAIVINFGVSALLLTLLYRVYRSNRSLDSDVFRRAEVEEDQAMGQESLR